MRPFDVDTFAQEVAATVDNQKDREQLRQSGRQWARRYNWDTVAKEQEAVYVQLLASDGTHSGRVSDTVTNGAQSEPNSERR